MVRVEIDSIRVSLMSQDRVVILKDTDTERYLAIWIGAFEAEAIRVELSSAPVQRPLTHDLLKQLIIQMGGELEQVIVNDLKNDIFFATLKIKANGKAIDVDARPSDAIALAVRLKVPIYVNDQVMDRAAIEPEEEVTSAEDSSPGPTETARSSAAAPQEGEDLGLFRDFLDTLDLDDFEEN